MHFPTRQIMVDKLGMQKWPGAAVDSMYSLHQTVSAVHEAAIPALDVNVMFADLLVPSEELILIVPMAAIFNSPDANARNKFGSGAVALTTMNRIIFYHREHDVEQTAAIDSNRSETKESASFTATLTGKAVVREKVWLYIIHAAQVFDARYDQVHESTLEAWAAGDVQQRTCKDMCRLYFCTCYFCRTFFWTCSRYVKFYWFACRRVCCNKFDAGIKDKKTFKSGENKFADKLKKLGRFSRKAFATQDDKSMQACKVEQQQHRVLRLTWQETLNAKSLRETAIVLPKHADIKPVLTMVGILMAKHRPREYWHQGLAGTPLKLDLNLLPQANKTAR